LGFTPTLGQSRVATSMANNVACVRTAHLHAHLDDDAKKA